MAEKNTVTVVCISDTHGRHRDLTIPDGDILIHAGDFTHFGKESDLTDFNDWLGTLPHKHKIVVNGNHETNASWKKHTQASLSNATFLKQSSTTLSLVRDGDLSVFGMDFFWPCRGSNPYYDQVPESTDILISHGPAKGCVDCDQGCASLMQCIERVRPKLVISGHIHSGHGMTEKEGIVFVNAAICGEGGYVPKYQPIVVNI